MPQSLSAKKRLRQNERRRLYNRSLKSEVKTLTRKLVQLVESRDRGGAEGLFPHLISKMDKAARKRVLHPNTIARKKSRVARLMRSLGGG